jgi:hypothetical protein
VARSAGERAADPLRVEDVVLEHEEEIEDYRDLRAQFNKDWSMKDWLMQCPRGGLVGRMWEGYEEVVPMTARLLGCCLCAGA